MHELWHVLVLGSTVFGVAGAALLVLAPLLFETTPPGLDRARALILGLLAFAGGLFLVEWFIVH
jgi:hypothetical protein